jgi:hypothetical protein
LTLAVTWRRPVLLLFSAKSARFIVRQIQSNKVTICTSTIVHFTINITSVGLNFGWDGDSRGGELQQQQKAEKKVFWLQFQKVFVYLGWFSLLLHNVGHLGAKCFLE